MSRAEYINAVVNRAMELGYLPAKEGCRILAATLNIMDELAAEMADRLPDAEGSEAMARIHREVHRRFDWVMVNETDKPW